MIFMSPLELNEFYFSSKPLLRKLTSYVFFKGKKQTLLSVFSKSSV